MLYLWTKKQMEMKEGTDRQPLLFNMEFVWIEFIHPIIIDMQVLAEKLVPALGLV